MTNLSSRFQFIAGLVLLGIVTQSHGQIRGIPQPPAPPLSPEAARARLAEVAGEGGNTLYSSTEIPLDSEPKTFCFSVVPAEEIEKLKADLEALKRA